MTAVATLAASSTAEDPGTDALLILDFSKLEYIDSASIGMLTGAHKEMLEAGGQIRVAGTQGAVDRTFKLIHMEKIMSVDADVATAQTALSQ